MIGTLRFSNSNCRVVFRGQMRTCSFLNCSSSLVQSSDFTMEWERRREQSLVCGALSVSMIKKKNDLSFLGSK